MLDRLIDDHRQFDGLLCALDTLLQPVPPRGRDADTEALDQRQALAALAERVRSYPDALHHRIETALFDMLVNKGLKPAEQRLIQRNLAEHGEIFMATDAAAAALESGVQQTSGLDDLDRAALSSYVSLQRRHMAREEDQLFPIAASLLDSEDWRSLEQFARALIVELEAT